MDKNSLKIDINLGFSSYQLSEKYKKSQTTILYWMKKFGLKSKNKRIGDGYKHFYGKTGKSKYETIDWERCQLLHDNGLTWRELVANKFTTGGIKWAIKNKKLLIRSNSDSLKLAHKSGKIDYSIYRTKKFRKNHIKCGGYREKSGRCKKILYNKKEGVSIYLQGTWEFKFAKFLDEKSINWEKNKVGYKYIFKGIQRLYFPDFFLNDYNLYVEVKGYETEKDKEKWKQFPFKLLVIRKNEIENLEKWFKILN